MVRVDEHRPRREGENSQQPAQRQPSRVGVDIVLRQEPRHQRFDHRQTEKHQADHALDVDVGPEHEQRQEPQQQTPVAGATGRQQKVQLDDEEEDAEQPRTRREQGEDADGGRQGHDRREAMVRLQSAEHEVQRAQNGHRHRRQEDPQAEKSKHLAEAVEQELRQPAIGHPGLALAVVGEVVRGGQGPMFGDPTASPQVPPDVRIADVSLDQQPQRRQQQDQAAGGQRCPGLQSGRGLGG